MNVNNILQLILTSMNMGQTGTNGITGNQNGFPADYSVWGGNNYQAPNTFTSSQGYSFPMPGFAPGGAQRPSNSSGVSNNNNSMMNMLLMLMLLMGLKKKDDVDDPTPAPATTPIEDIINANDSLTLFGTDIVYTGEFDDFDKAKSDLINQGASIKDTKVTYNGKEYTLIGNSSTAYGDGYDTQAYNDFSNSADVNEAISKHIDDLEGQVLKGGDGTTWLIAGIEAKQGVYEILAINTEDESDVKTVKLAGSDTTADLMALLSNTEVSEDITTAIAGIEGLHISGTTIEFEGKFEDFSEAKDSLAATLGVSISGTTFTYDNQQYTIIGDAMGTHKLDDTDTPESSALHEFNVQSVGIAGHEKDLEGQVLNNSDGDEWMISSVKSTASGYELSVYGMGGEHNGQIETITLSKTAGTHDVITALNNIKPSGWTLNQNDKVEGNWNVDVISADGNSVILSQEFGKEDNKVKVGHTVTGLDGAPSADEVEAAFSNKIEDIEGTENKFKNTTFTDGSGTVWKVVADTVSKNDDGTYNLEIKANGSTETKTVANVKTLDEIAIAISNNDFQAPPVEYDFKVGDNVVGNWIVGTVDLEQKYVQVINVVDGEFPITVTLDDTPTMAEIKTAVNTELGNRGGGSDDLKTGKVPADISVGGGWTTVSDDLSDSTVILSQTRDDGIIIKQPVTGLATSYNSEAEFKDAITAKFDLDKTGSNGKDFKSLNSGIYSRNYAALQGMSFTINGNEYKVTNGTVSSTTVKCDKTGESITVKYSKGITINGIADLIKAQVSDDPHGNDVIYPYGAGDDVVSGWKVGSINKDSRAVTVTKSGEPSIIVTVDTSPTLDELKTAVNRVLAARENKKPLITTLLPSGYTLSGSIVSHTATSSRESESIARTTLSRSLKVTIGVDNKFTYDGKEYTFFFRPYSGGGGGRDDIILPEFR